MLTKVVNMSTKVVKGSIDKLIVLGYNKDDMELVKISRRGSNEK